MKKYFFILSLFYLLVAFNPLSAKQTSQDFQPGDWFESEMEFVHNTPVFHNHWTNNDSIDFGQEYLVVRFTLSEKITDSVAVWQYKVVRYRVLSPGHSPNQVNDGSNVHCFDSWYPNYFDDKFDSIRQSLKGEVRLVHGLIEKHCFEYDNIGNKNGFGAASIFPVDYGNSFGSSTICGVAGELSKSVERLITLLFSTKQIVNSQNESSEHYSYDQIKYTGSDSALFSITPKDSWVIKNKYTAYFLPNGLSYAFTDRYRQKVLAITNASFDLPNKAIVLVKDLRENKQVEKENLDLVNFWPQSNSYLISSNKEQYDGVSKYTFTLKGGVEFIVNGGSAHISPKLLFISPGDSIQVIIEDVTEDNAKLRNDPEFVKFCKTAKLSEDSIRFLINMYQSRPVLKIKGTPNYLESSEMNELSEASIRYPSFSEEFKAWLLLKNKLDEELNNIGRNPDML